MVNNEEPVDHNAAPNTHMCTDTYTHTHTLQVEQILENSGVYYDSQHTLSTNVFKPDKQSSTFKHSQHSFIYTNMACCHLETCNNTRAQKHCCVRVYVRVCVHTVSHPCSQVKAALRCWTLWRCGTNETSGRHDGAGRGQGRTLGIRAIPLKLNWKYRK